jgi:asparagine synthase (glutamine-hydrolysing)
MCSIAGLLDKTGSDISANLLMMLTRTSHRGPDGCGVYIGNKVRKAKKLQELDTHGIEGNLGVGHTRLKITGSSGIQPLAGCDRRFVLAFNGEIWNYMKLRSELISKGHIFETDSDSEIIIHLVEEMHKKNSSFSKMILDVVKRIDGEYAFVVYDSLSKKAILARDQIGIKQIYYGFNSRYVGFCSEKKPLLQIGIKPQRVPPGRLVQVDLHNNFDSFTIVGKNQLPRPRKKISNQKRALERYKKVLFDSIKKRVEGQEEIGIIFSGGVDSVLVAKIADMLGAKITCYTSGFENSPDVLASQKVSKELGWKLKINNLTPQKISSEIENIVSSIETSNHLQIDVAIPVYFAVKLAKEDKIKVMLTGQGADELFGGYEWYKEILHKGGPKSLSECLWKDIENLHKDTLEREDKITMYHSIELRVPYLDPQVIMAAMSISEDLKIRDDKVKFIHRKLAEELGVPPSIAWRKKEAAQHGSSVHKNLLDIMENWKVSIPDTANTPHPSEDLGSVYRYSGNIYVDSKIQLILDSIGKKVGIC